MIKALRHFAICISIICGCGLALGGMLGLAFGSAVPVVVLGVMSLAFALVIFAASVGDEPSSSISDNRDYY